MISIKIIICFSYLFMCNYILYRSFIAVWIIINKIYLNITRKHNFLLSMHYFYTHVYKFAKNM